MLPRFTKEVEKEWLENLLLNEDRETYHAMTADQKRVVRFAYLYGITREK